MLNNKQKKYSRASFKGIYFEVDSCGYDSGRRGQLHEFPGRDSPYFEDFGKKAYSFTIEAFIFGDDYEKRRDDLRQACISDNSGELVHPTFGSIDCYCTDLSVSESVSSGKIASFSMTFTEAGINKLLQQVEDHKQQVLSSADALEVKAADDLQTNLTFSGLDSIALVEVSEFVEEIAIKINKSISKAAAMAINTIEHTVDNISSIALNITDLVNKNVNKISNKYSMFTTHIKEKLTKYIAKVNKIKGYAQDVLSIVDIISDAVKQANDLKDNFDEILRTPSKLVESFKNTFDLIKNSLDYKSMVNEFKEIMDIKNYNDILLNIIKDIDQNKKKVLMTISKKDIEAQAIKEEIRSFIGCLAVVNLAREIIGIKIASISDAEDILNDFLSIVEPQLPKDSFIDQEKAYLLTELKTSVISYISEELKRLPVLEIIQLPESIPSVVLSYNYYSDITKSDEICFRNKISHPGFLPAYKKLEIIK